MKMLIKEIDGCKDCLYNKHSMCYYLSRPLQKLSFELDCSLPSTENYHNLTKYVTKESSVRCCGNCDHWKKWGYNPHLQVLLGTCNKEDTLQFYPSHNDACTSFTGNIGKGKFPRKCDEKVKMKYVIKTLLSCNKGKKFTAKEICEFIVENKLNSRNSMINQSTVSRLIKSDVYLLRSIQIDEDSHPNRYYINID